MDLIFLILTRIFKVFREQTFSNLEAWEYELFKA